MLRRLFVLSRCAVLNFCMSFFESDSLAEFCGEHGVGACRVAGCEWWHACQLRFCIVRGDHAD